MSGRSGKHVESKTFMGAYVTPEVKALALMTSDRLGITVTDIILNGLRNEARRAGLTDAEGRILDKYKASFEAMKELCIVKRAERKQK